MTNLPTDQDHGIMITKHEDGTGYTISRYSDDRGQAHDLQASILEDPVLASLGNYDSEAGCFFATTAKPLEAQLIAGAILTRLAPERRTGTALQATAALENQITEAADRLQREHGYDLEDLIEILTSKEG